MVHAHAHHSHGSVTAVSGFNITDCALPPNAILSGHAHDRLHLCLIATGAFEERRGRGSEWCGTGTTRLSPARESHHLLVGSDGARCILIEAPGAFDEHCTGSIYCDDSRIAKIGHEIQSQIDVGDRGSSRTVVMKVRELFAQLLLRKHGRQVAPPNWLESVRDHLHAHFRESIRIDDIAQIAGVNPMHLIRVFRKNLGVTVGEFIRHHRVELATKLVMDNDLPLACIAADCGFSDQSHMTRIFRKTTGVTPLQLRRLEPAA